MTCSHRIRQTEAGWGDWVYGFSYRVVKHCTKCEAVFVGYSSTATDPKYYQTKVSEA